MYIFNKITSVFLLVFFAVNLGNAQVTGYQGKRFFIEFSVGGMFNHANPTIDNLGPQSFPNNQATGLTFRSQYALGVNYTLTRKQVLQLSYELMPSGLSMNRGITTLTQLLFPGTSNLTVLEEVPHKFFYTLLTHKVDVNVLFYGKRVGNLAPLGVYSKLGLAFANTIGLQKLQEVAFPYLESTSSNTARTYYEYKTYQKDEARPETVQFVANPSVVMIGINVALGYRTIIANRLTFSLELGTTLYPQTLLANVQPINDNISLAEFEQYYQQRVINRTQLNHLLNFKIGVGVLIF